MKLSKKVNLTSKKAMVEFLDNHFRYDTMNSWNRSTSYANNLKINRVIPSDLQNKVYQMMECEGFYDEINDLISCWDLEQDYNYQAGFNGRSGGYLVMYVGNVEIKTIFKFDSNNDRDYADGYGWLTLEEAKEKGLYKKQIQKIGSYPGRSIDADEDFNEWSMFSLKDRVKLVQSFDQLCDDIITLVCEMAKDYEVEEETYLVEKTRKNLV